MIRDRLDQPIRRRSVWLRTSGGARSAAMLEKAGTIAEGSAPAGVSYEARVLDRSEVGMSLLWLHAAGDEEDRFYSLTTSPSI